MDELKPCPNPECGSNDNHIVSEESDYHFVACLNPDCVLWGPKGKTPEEAREKWNALPREPVWTKELNLNAVGFYLIKCGSGTALIRITDGTYHGVEPFVTSGTVEYLTRYSQFEFAGPIFGGPIPEPRSK